MSDTYTVIHGNTKCAVCGKTRRCKRNADGSRLVCFRESAETANGYTRVALKNGISTYVLGELIAAQKATVGLAKGGGDTSTGSRTVPVREPPTLADAGIDKKLSSQSQKLAAITAAEKSTGGALAGVWDYSDSFAVARFDTADGKQFRPIHRDKSGWKVGDPPGPLPLYRAGELRGVARVYTVEGEACADAAIAIGLTAITSAHGAKAAGKADWSPLNGVAEVVFLPDNDDAGAEYVAAACKRIAELDNPPTVKSIKLPGLPPKGDIVEFIEARDSQAAESIVAEIESLADATALIDLDYQAGGLHVESAANIEPREVAWLWPNRIPIGKLTVFAGDPKIGKSLLTTDLAARVSSGARWPDQITICNTARRVIMFSAEDDTSDTIIPRLKAAAANLSNILIVAGVKNADGPGDVPFTIDAHLRQLERLLKRTANVGLMTIDPISAFIGGKVDSHNNSDVRGLLAPLAELAADYRVAIVFVTHLYKGGGGKALYRAMGSLAFTAAARAVWLVTKDQEDPKRILMLNAGMNLARDPGGLAYGIEDCDGLPVLAWELGRVETDADDAIAVENKDNERKTAIEHAKKFVRDQLQAGPMPAKELDAAAAAVGISVATLKRAKSKLGVTAEQQRADGKVTGWVVSLGQSPEALTGMPAPLDTVDTLDTLALRGQKGGLLGAQGDQGDQGAKRYWVSLYVKTDNPPTKRRISGIPQHDRTRAYRAAKVTRIRRNRLRRRPSRPRPSGTHPVRPAGQVGEVSRTAATRQAARREHEGRSDHD